jgi:S-adenosylmethionine:tRNA ribosyltransferase-isomerase
MRLSDLDYDLPPDRIASHPAEPRDESRLLVLPRGEGPLRHHRFSELPALLRPGDLLVLNDTRVIRARLHGRRDASGGKVECLLVTKAGGEGRWTAMLRAGGRLRAGESLTLGEGALRARLLEKDEEGVWTIALEGAGAAGAPEDADRLIERHGEVPLPPYIRRAPEAADAERYQTTFARAPGSVAAPTAGLHFTPALLERLAAAGVERAFVTLHVGPGTFRPIEVEDPREHPIHPERYEVPPETVAALEAARRRGARVVACGTTSVRTLESFARGGAREGETRLLIAPGHVFRLVDAVITNFHLPRSSLLMLVAAFAGLERIRAAYAEAIARGYRFYSYGDAMLIE